MNGEKVIVQKPNSVAVFLAFVLILGIALYFGSPVRSQQMTSAAAIPAGTQRPTTTSMPTLTPTPAINYQQTVSVAEATSEEAMRLMVAVTAEQDRRDFAQAEWTVTAEAIQYQYQSMTQQAAQFTATAYATSIPATQTRQAAVDMARATDVMMTLIAPTQLHAMAEAETYAEYADELQASELVIRFVVAMFISALALLTLVMIISKVISIAKPAEPAPTIPQLDPDPLPFVTVTDNPNVLLRAEIPCTSEQLLELAEGVIRRNMTLAVGQWEGTCVHKSIKEIRAFFIQHHFAKVLVGKGGELGIEKDGEFFLADVLRLGSPPPPYTTT